MNKSGLTMLTAMLLAHLNAGAQQPTPAYRFLSQVSSGITIGGYAFTPTTKVDSIVLNDAGAVAFTAHRENGGSGSDQTAVLTSKRVVAREGDVLAGKTLIRIATAVVAINNADEVAYEALYSDSAHGGKLHGGVFVEKRFVTEFEPSPTGAASEFLLADDGRVLLKDGAITPAVRKPLGGRNILTAARQLENATIRHTVQRTNQDIAWGSRTVAEQVTLDELGKPGTAKKPNAAPSSSVPKACPSPAFPLPQDWALGAAMSGPLAVESFEVGTKAKPYDSPFFGHVDSPFRQIQFSASCKPLIIAIGDGRAQGRFEIYTPAGLLTYLKPEGSYAFPGFDGGVTSGHFLRSDAIFTANRRGQILLSVTVGNGFAVLLATPTSDSK